MGKLKAKIKAILDELSTGELLRVWNEYQDNTNGEGRIYYMDDFNEIFNGCEPWEIARACYYSGKFCPAHDYFWFNGYGNAESSDWIEDAIYTDDIADHIAETGNAYDIAEIQEILDALEEEQDEESDEGEGE